MRYVSVEDCRRLVFPYIHRYLSAGEAAPDYEKEVSGMQELNKVLTLVKDDTYYRTFAEKAAYLVCGLAGAQYFSNGNKRLGVTVLLSFLGANRAALRDRSVEEYRDLLQRRFPKHVWEDNPNIGGTHSLFLYNMAIVIGDRAKWGAAHFDKLREEVAGMFASLYSIGG